MQSRIPLDIFIALLVTAINNPPFPGGLFGLNACRPLVFLALFGQFFPAFFRMNENVVRISEILFPFLADFAVAAPIVKLKLVQVFKKFLVDFGLQLLRETGEQFCRF
jgi:hypothetical protein